jgi:LysM repeat protein
MAPTSKIRPNAEYDAAAALIQLKDWETAASVLAGFRKNFPENPLQPKVTKKIAYVYRENNKLSLAANEYERIERESQDDEIRQDALLVAAELYEQDGDSTSALEVYRRYVDYFPQPVELNLEIRNKITVILTAQNDLKSYLDQLKKIVDIDASAGKDRTPRTRYLAANAALVLAEKKFETFKAVQLINPLEANLKKKQKLMKELTQEFNRLIEYEIGETTAAATFYLAEIYAHFSKALMTSERPVLTFDYYEVKPGDTLSAIAKRNNSDVDRIARENDLNKSNFIVAGKKLKIPRGLYPIEMEQYELAIEEQAYPFEEQAITAHESNLELISRGVYNEWIEKSLEKLAEFFPARYDKPEESSDIISSLDTYIFEIERPESSESEAAGIEEPETAGTAHAQAEEDGSVMESETAWPAQTEEGGPETEPETEETEQAEKSVSVIEPEAIEPEQAEEAGPETEPETEETGQAEKSASVIEPEAIEPETTEAGQDEEPASVTEPEIVTPAQVDYMDQTGMDQAVRR